LSVVVLILIVILILIHSFEAYIKELDTDKPLKMTILLMLIKLISILIN